MCVRPRPGLASALLQHLRAPVLSLADVSEGAGDDTVLSLADVSEGARDDTGDADVGEQGVSSAWKNDGNAC